MAFQPKYVLTDHTLAEMFGLQYSDYTTPLSEYDILAGIIKYALSHEGMMGQTLNYDAALWTALSLTTTTTVTTQSIWSYLAKYLETASTPL